LLPARLTSAFEDRYHSLLPLCNSLLQIEPMQ
jgi:hypothetical protein